MPAEHPDLPPPVKHIFVDFENVHEIDLNIIGSKTIHVTLLLGPRQTKLDVALVEKLLEHAASVQLVRLASAGKNALDFTLAYYLGRAVADDPTGDFHIISKDAGYDPLIEHLRSKHIGVSRQEDYASLPFSTPAHPPAASLPPVASKSAPLPKSTVQPPSVASVVDWEQRVLEHLRNPTTKRPGTHQKLVRYLITHLGNKIPEVEATQLVANLGQAGHLFVDDGGKVTYHLLPA